MAELSRGHLGHGERRHPPPMVDLSLFDPLVVFAVSFGHCFLRMENSQSNLNAFRRGKAFRIPSPDLAVIFFPELRFHQREDALGRLAKSLSFAEKGMTEQQPERGFVYPSAFRRFAFFVIWSFLTLTFSYALLDGFLSLAVGSVRGDQLLKSADPFVTLFALILLVVMASLAARGLLPGAKKKPQIPALQERS